MWTASKLSEDRRIQTVAIWVRWHAMHIPLVQWIKQTDFWVFVVLHFISSSEQLLGSIMRCKAWNCTLMWGPPNKKTEITTHFEQRSCTLTAFLANIWWHRRALTAFSGKDSGFVTDNVRLFTWTGASVYQLLFSILGCHCRGRWPTRSSKLFWICITFLFSKYFHRSCFTFML